MKIAKGILQSVFLGMAMTYISFVSFDGFKICFCDLRLSNFFFSMPLWVSLKGVSWLFKEAVLFGFLLNFYYIWNQSRKELVGFP